MITNIFRALLFTVITVIVIAGLIATIYVAMWIVLALAVILLFSFIYHTLQAKDSI